MTTDTERRLTAILAADVAGYCRLMAADQEGTLRRLKTLHAELIGPCIAEHNGRIVNTTGGGLLAEFVGVLDAVRCASAWQTGLAARDPEAAVGNRIAFRIGIHLGDIIFAQGDVNGDQASVTGGLKARGEPGAIYITTAAYEQVRDELDLTVGQADQEHGEVGAGLSPATSPPG